MSEHNGTNVPRQRTSRDPDRRELLRLRRRDDKHVEEYETRAALRAAAPLLSVRRIVAGAR